MNIWETLGIDTTSDKNKIKLAYAAKAKRYHPEENPEEYQLLRQAYKAALEYAKTKNDPGDQIGQDDQAYGIVMLENPEGSEAQEQKEIVEEAGPLHGIDDSGEVIHQDAGLDYEEVEKSIQREVYDQFLQEFRYISFNPCLRNNFFCWRHFFSKADYQRIFLNEGFRQEFVHMVSEGLFWSKETLDFFDRRLQDLSEGMAPEGIVWERARRRHRLKKLLLGNSEREMGEIHRIIMQQVEATGIPTDRRAQNRKEAEVYLQFYLSYAKKHEDEVEQWYRNECKGILKQRIMLLFFLAALFVVLCILTLI